MATHSPITVARFWSKVDVRPSSLECWEWRASVNRQGYGKFKDCGSVRNANAVAWEIANDAPLRGAVTRHSCDNPKCCNPAHLAKGTQADNMQDMVDRGRGRNWRASGEANPNARLTAADVAVIRGRIREGQSNSAIAADYPVSSSMISKIRTSAAWGVDSGAAEMAPIPDAQPLNRDA